MWWIHHLKGTCMVWVYNILFGQHILLALVTCNRNKIYCYILRFSTLLRYFVVTLIAAIYLDRYILRAVQLELNVIHIFNFPIYAFIVILFGGTLVVYLYLSCNSIHGPFERREVEWDTSVVYSVRISRSKYLTLIFDVNVSSSQSTCRSCQWTSPLWSQFDHLPTSNSQATLSWCMGGGSQLS